MITSRILTIVAFLLSATPAYAATNDTLTCTLEAKLCPDGVTYVMRLKPDCEFSKCPTHACIPYQCKDGTQVSRCTADGVTINYFAAPCLTHGGETDAVPFSDVSFDHPNAAAIAYLKDQDLVSGYPDGTFKADQPINRAEFTKIIMNGYNGLDVVPKQCGSTNGMYLPFSDVHQGDWFAFRVCLAVEASIVQGYPDGTFRPSANINFVEAAKIIAHSFKLPFAHTDIWFEGSVRALADSNAIPTSIARFDQPITRGEMAEMIYRLKAGMTDLPSKTYEQLSQPPTVFDNFSQWGSWSENGYFFRVPKNWNNARDNKGRTIFVDGRGVVRAMLTCPIPQAGYEAWDFQESHRMFSEHGQQYGATLWLGHPRDPIDGLEDFNLVFMHRNTFDHWYDEGDEQYSCELTSGAGELDDDIWMAIYRSVEVLSE